MRARPVSSPAFFCLVALATSALPVHAAAKCPVQHADLLNALKASVKASGGPTNGGLDTHEWAAVVDRDGKVCAVVFSGPTANAQWPASRLVAAEKANTANGLSVKETALSTANLYAPTQPAGPIYGLEASNPVNIVEAYAGDPAAYGTEKDPLVGKTIGGVVVFGGGLALYDGTNVVGGLGVSGDSSCADHNVAWRLRKALQLDKVPTGINPQAKDAIVYDLDPNGKSASGWGHPKCPGTEADIAAEIGAGVGGTLKQ